MRTFKFLLIIASLVGYLIIGCLLRLFLLWAGPNTFIRALNRLKYYLMQIFKLIAGLNVTVRGRKDVLKDSGLFIISTHIGYLDGIILGSLVPGTFTTKEEIRRIPLIGGVVAIGGTIFINRHEKSKIVHYVDLMADRLRNNINIFNFPEGHATDGARILPFFSAFFDAPLKTRAPIVPVTINYESADGRPINDRDDICCYGGRTSIVSHLWNVLKFKSLGVSVFVHDKIEINGFRPDHQGRKSISEMCLQRLALITNLPISQDHPLKSPPRWRPSSIGEQMPRTD